MINKYIYYYFFLVALFITHIAVQAEGTWETIVIKLILIKTKPFSSFRWILRPLRGERENENIIFFITLNANRAWV